MKVKSGAPTNAVATVVGERVAVKVWVVVLVGVGLVVGVLVLEKTTMGVEVLVAAGLEDGVSALVADWVWVGVYVAGGPAGLDGGTPKCLPLQAVKTIAISTNTQAFRIPTSRIRHPLEREASK